VRRLVLLPLCLLIAVVVFGPMSAPPATAQTASDPVASGAAIRVAVKPLVPFVMTRDGKLEGYSIDLWTRIATDLGLDTQWVETATVKDLLAAVQNGEADAGIAGISMTPEREQVIDFTHPYFDSGLQILTRDDDSSRSFFSAFDWLFRRSFLVPVLVFALIVAVFGHLIWFVERRHNDDFPTSYGRGIIEAMWWSLATVAGGDAEKKVEHPFGRLIAATWLVFGLFLVAYVTGTVTASLTVTELRGSINGLDDLGGKKVATVRGTVADTFLQQTGFDRVLFDDADAAIGAVRDRRADAVVFDSPVLRYYASHAGRGQVRVVGEMFRLDKYAIALPEGSELRERVDEVLLRLNQTGYLQELYQRWFDPA
jgi:polar amino acid transport system substrate-binding protein